MKKLPVSKIQELFAAIRAQQTLYIPTDDASGQARYLPWQEGMELTRALNTVRSAKEIEIIDSRTEQDDFVIFGVRACDARSFTILDKVFLIDPIDTYYKNRREHGTVVTLACTQPEETCFCTTFGIDPADPEGDAACWIAGDSLYLKARTEKGERLLSALDNLLADADEGEIAAQQKATRDIAQKLPFAKLNLAGFNGENLNKLFDSKKWPELSEACLGCGTCTFVCPTCQCYDIRDFDTGHGVKRFRCWDSCMYSDFTLMAHGNSRNSQVERFRQRFMHKEGEYGCVGCGRCLAKCPISMNIVKVAKALEGEVQ